MVADCLSEKLDILRVPGKFNLEDEAHLDRPDPKVADVMKSTGSSGGSLGNRIWFIHVNIDEKATRDLEDYRTS